MSEMVRWARRRQRRKNQIFEGGDLAAACGYDDLAFDATIIDAVALRPGAIPGRKCLRDLNPIDGARLTHQQSALSFMT